MKNKQYYVYNKPYIYVVLEHSFGTQDCKVHGVYTTKESAEGKRNKLKAKGANGYLAVLKKPIEGTAPHIWYINEREHSTQITIAS